MGSVAAIADVTLFHTHDWKSNALATRPQDLQFFYWSMRTARGLGIAMIDAGLAGFLWATSTNRLFVIPVSTAERLEDVTRVMEATRGKLGAVGIVRNVTVRDESLRKKAEAYWKREGDVMGEVMSEKEVVDGLRGALESGRINVPGIEEEAIKYAEGIIGEPEAAAIG